MLDRQETLDLLEEIDRDKQNRQLAYHSLDVFFLLVLLALIAAIILRYLLY